MSDFVKGIVKLAKEYRASEQDARFSRKRIAIDDYTDSELSQKLLYEDKQQNVKKISQKNKILCQKIRFLLDKLQNPSSTSGCKFTDYKYTQKIADERKIDWHHITGLFNKEPSSTLKRKLNILDSIIKKITNNSLSFKDVFQNKLFTKQQIQLIDQLFNCRQRTPGYHVNQHKNINKAPMNSWENTIIASLAYDNIRDFFEVIKQALLSFEISNKQIHTMKEDFVNYLLNWGNPQHRSRLSRLLLKISRCVKND